MPLYKRSYFFIGLLLLTGNLIAQSGGPLLSHFRESNEIENQSWAICQDENNVMMFANIRGILTFDGQTWNSIRVPVIPYSLKYNRSRKRVYIGSENDYGYIQRDDKGFYRFVSMHTDTSRTGIISKIIFTDSTVWFYGERTILRHDLKTGALQLKLSQRRNKPFTGMFFTPKNIFINVSSEGLYRLESDTLFPIVTGYLLEKNEVLFGLPYDRNMVLLGLGDGSLSLFDGIKFYPYQINDDGYLRENSLSEGLVVSDSLYAFSTLDGGAMVVEKKSGKVRFTINYLNGLPDDEIFAIGSDHNNGLWLSHQYGLTRVELMLPVANLGVYPGLKGNLINPVWFNNELYVATSEGLYYLTEVKSYSETQVLVRKDQTVSAAGSAEKTLKGAEQQGQESKKSRRSIFSKIFGKKYSPDQQTAQAEGKTAAGKGKGKGTIAEPVYVRKTVSRLKSIDYLFRKVEGLDEKCRQLVSTPGGILASTVRGLYVISGNKAKIITAERNINFISSSTGDGKYYIAAADGYFYIQDGPGGWTASFPDRTFNLPLYSIAPASNNVIWAGGDDMALKIETGVKPNYRVFNIKTDYPQHCKVSFTNDTLFIFNESDLSYYDNKADSIIRYNRVTTVEGQRAEFMVSQPGALWVKQETGWFCIGSWLHISSNDLAILKIFDNIISIYSQGNILWILTANNQVYRIERDKVGTMKASLNMFIRSVQNDRGLYFNISHVVFERGDNNVYFDIVAPGYQKRNPVVYQYIVDGMMKDWSKWSPRSTINLLLPHGTYNLRVRAKDIWENISIPRQLTFTIKTPFTQTTLFFIVLLVIGLAAVVLIVRFRERQLQREKRILEEKVKERTAEIEAQKQEITSSIEYASRIQLALLPMQEIFKNAFRDHFIMFRPRDIVSGDFYWIGEDSNHIFFTVADCTGHGVPGAFMSTLGISTLNEIITNKTDLHAHTVLNLLRTKIKTSLHQTGKEGETADGMDIAFCILHKNRKILEYAGAYNPLMIHHGGELKEYKADRMPIGIYVGEKESFTNYEINVSRGDVIYLFSDGIADQFGGPDCSKFKKSTLKKLFSAIAVKSLEEQKCIVEEEFDKWRGSNDQIDDVTVIGVKI